MIFISHFQLYMSSSPLVTLDNYCKKAIKGNISTFFTCLAVPSRSLALWKLIWCFICRFLSFEIFVLMNHEGCCIKMWIFFYFFVDLKEDNHGCVLWSSIGYWPQWNKHWHTVVWWQSNSRSEYIQWWHWGIRKSLSWWGIYIILSFLKLSKQSS